MKPLLGIFTCHRYTYPPNDWIKHPVMDRVAALRDTWLKDVTIDYKLFYGKGGNAPGPDEVFLTAPDDYLGSSHKLKTLVKWALAHGYDRLLKVDDDVFVHWDRMVADRSFTEGDYVGGGFSANEAYAHGPCYWLSRRSMEIVASSPIGSEWAEDRWVGLSLNRHNIFPRIEPRFYNQRAPEGTRLQFIDETLLDIPSVISLHAVPPSMMRAYYRSTSQR